MKVYIFDEFVVTLGYKRDVIKRLQIATIYLKRSQKNLDEPTPA